MANGRGRKVQATLDLLGIPYTGTGYLSGAPKWTNPSQTVSSVHGVPPTPNWRDPEKGQSEPLSGFGLLELPVVVKPCCGSSVGVYCTRTKNTGRL